MGDIRERTAVDKRRIALQRLNEVRIDGVPEQGGHCAHRVEITGEHRCAGICVGNQDIAQALLEVLQISRQAEDSHDLAGNGDLEVILAGNSVHLAAHADNDIAQRSVIHVQDALEQYPADVYPEGVTLLDMVIHEGCEQIVSSSDGVHVAGEVQVDVLHRDHLGVSAAGCAALDSEHRTEGRLTQCQDSLPAGLVHSFAQTNGSRGLALACRGRIDGGHKYQLPVRLISKSVEQLLVQLCLVVTVLLYLVLLNSEICRDLGYLLHLRLLCDLNICKHFVSSVIT